MSKFGYSWEKLFDGMQCLAGIGNIQERLIRAYQSGIYLIVAPHALPDKELHKELKAICDALTASEDNIGQGKLTSTIREMSDEQADQYAMRILGLYDKVTRLHAQEEC